MASNIVISQQNHELMALAFQSNTTLPMGE